MPLLEVIAIQKTAAPLRRQVLDGLRSAIISGRLAPGQRLTEPALTKMMGVSRTVVREALRQLESEGLVTIVPNRGPIVRELSVAEAKDLYRIRGVLEGLAVRLFAKNASADDIQKLQRALVVVSDAYRKKQVEKILAAKNNFYNVLYAGARSEMLGAMLSSLHARIWRWRALGLSHSRRSVGRSRESVQNLKSMLSAIKKRDAAAAERIARMETERAAAEVMRLLSAGDGRLSENHSDRRDNEAATGLR